MTVHPKSGLLVRCTHGAVIVANMVRPCIILTNTFKAIGLLGTLCLPLLVPSDGTVVYLQDGLRSVPITYSIQIVLFLTIGQHRHSHRTPTHQVYHAVRPPRYDISAFHFFSKIPPDAPRKLLRNIKLTTNASYLVLLIFATVANLF